MSIYAYRRNTKGDKPFHVFKIAVKKGETEFSFFDDYIPADDARDMVEDATKSDGSGPVLFVWTKTVRKSRVRKLT